VSILRVGQGAALPAPAVATPLGRPSYAQECICDAAPVILVARARERGARSQIAVAPARRNHVSEGPLAPSAEVDSQHSQALRAPEVVAVADELLRAWHDYAWVPLSVDSREGGRR
jgi:hypothetical protein